MADPMATLRIPCRADRDGDCYWSECPQEADDRANYQPEGCPLWLNDPCICDPEQHPRCPVHGSQYGSSTEEQP